MKVFRLVLIIFCFSLGTSCVKQQDKDNGETIRIDVGKDFKSLIPDSIFSHVKYIPLETTDTSLIGNIDKILEIDSLYYIHDKNQATIYIYNNQGKYLKKLYRRGRGYGEYITLDDFFVRDSMIYVLSSDMKKVLIYDSNLIYLSDIKLESFGTNISYINDELYHYTNYSSNDLNLIYIYDITKQVCVNRFYKYNKEQSGVRYERTTFASNLDTMFAFFPYDYKIYSITQGDINARFNIDFGSDNMYPISYSKYSDKKRMAYNERYSDFTEYPISGIDNLYINNHLIYFSFINSIFNYSFFMNNKNTYYGVITGTKKFPLANNQILAVSNREYMCFTTPNEILELKRKGFTLPKILDAVKLEDNPILCIYKLAIGNF